ncbi:PEP-CTERM sorting domain-containing protein [Massilia sp. METH4]|uniref:PEP-CTERM sorting domain-containing protein n=1 Tax=Massilia sp. METH4 TaxID=3123041 RepID=UPI0030CAEEE5
MKTIKQAAVGVAVAVAAMASAHAAPQTVGGVTWDPEYGLDFSSSSVQMHQIFEPDGTARGFGIVSTMNGTGQDQFCPGCELTIVYGGYTPASTEGGTTLYTGGYVRIYMNDGPSTINPSDPLTMNDDNVGLGTLWLDLAGHEYNGYTLRGTVNSMMPPNLSGLGQLDVVGGVAAQYFDTNMQAGGADLAFSSSFTQPYPGADNHVVGTGNFYGMTTAVPEPSTYVMLGGGLLALGFLRRRSQA